MPSFDSRQLGLGFDPSRLPWYFTPMFQIILIALFGAMGAVGRYTVSGWVYRIFGESFPLGTLVVNLIGCFLLGMIAHAGQSMELIPVVHRRAISVGMLGAFTTFSTFGYETLRQLQAGQWHLGLTNIAANVVLGLLCVWVGIETARYFVGGA